MIELKVKKLMKTVAKGFLKNPIFWEKIKLKHFSNNLKLEDFKNVIVLVLYVKRNLHSI